jgi:hypothetical protein
MDKEDIVALLKQIPAEFHHNDYATRAIAVAIKRINEYERKSNGTTQFAEEQTL